VWHRNDFIIHEQRADLSALVKAETLKASIGRVYMANDGPALEAKVNAVVAEKLNTLKQDAAFKDRLIQWGNGGLSEIPGGGGIGVKLTVWVKTFGGLIVLGKQEFMVGVKTGVGSAAPHALLVTSTLGDHAGPQANLKERLGGAFTEGLDRALRSGLQWAIPLNADAITKQLFAEAQKTMSGLGFTQFIEGLAEFTTPGSVRLQFRATRSDGQRADYPVDFKYDQAGNFHAERAFLSARSDVAVSDQEQSALDGLLQLAGNGRLNLGAFDVQNATRSSERDSQQ